MPLAPLAATSERAVALALANGCCSKPTGVCTRWSPQNAGLPAAFSFVGELAAVRH